MIHWQLRVKDYHDDEWLDLVERHKHSWWRENPAIWSETIYTDDLLHEEVCECWCDLNFADLEYPNEINRVEVKRLRDNLVKVFDVEVRMVPDFHCTELAEDKDEYTRTPAG